MPDIPGKTVTVHIEDSEGSGSYTKIAKATVHRLTISNSEVEVSHKDSGGFRDLFPQGSIKSLGITMSGLFDGTAAQLRLRAVAESTTDTSANFRFVDGNGEELQGRFQVSSFEFGGETEGFASYDATLASTGVITRQAES